MCPSPSDVTPDPSPSEPSPLLLEDPTPSSPLFRSPSSPPLPPTPDPHPSWLPDDAPEPSDLPAGGFGSPPPSTEGRPQAGKVKLRELRTLAKQVIKTAGGLANNLLTAPGTAERAYGLYVPDAEDEKAISDPLASLASRRLPEGTDNPDVSDLVRLAFALLLYGVKQKDKAYQLRDVAPPLDLDESGAPDEDEGDQ